MSPTEQAACGKALKHSSPLRTGEEARGNCEVSNGQRAQNARLGQTRKGVCKAAAATAASNTDRALSRCQAPVTPHFTDGETAGGAAAKAGSSGVLETSGATGEKEDRKEGKFNTHLAPLGTRHPAGLLDVESVIILTPEDSTIVSPILEIVKLSVQEERQFP